MYDIALSVSAIARSGTRADVAWMVAPTASDETLAFTPGGGRLGSLANGAFDGLLADIAARKLSAGRHVRHSVTELESLMSGLPVGSAVEFLIVPAAEFPPEMWSDLLKREAVAITVMISEGDVTGVRVATAANAQSPELELLTAAQPVIAHGEGSITTVLAPVPRLVVAGAGPIAEALATQAGLLGWKVSVESRPDIVAGMSATLSWLDAIVVMGHEIEPSSRCLMAALESDAGYIGALGSRAMQEARGDWLAYREVTDLSRVHGPAGLSIGARNPAEIAVSIVAEIVAERARA
jgi:xanthine dehydrogenase accessory factor